MMLSELSDAPSTTTAHGFQLRAHADFFPTLLELLADTVWDSRADFLLRYITGFGVFRFRFNLPKQPITDWVFINVNSAMPTPEELFHYTLRRIVLLRYRRAGVRFHFFNRSSIAARATRAADRLIPRLNPNEVA